MPSCHSRQERRFTFRQGLVQVNLSLNGRGESIFSNFFHLGWQVGWSCMMTAPNPRREKADEEFSIADQTLTRDGGASVAAIGQNR
jgi:hypothetical protein